MGMAWQHIQLISLVFFKILKRNRYFSMAKTTFWTGVAFCIKIIQPINRAIFYSYICYFICTNFLQWNILVQIMHFLVQNMHCIWCKFSIMIRKICAGTTPSKGAIWDPNTNHIQCPIFILFLVRIGISAKIMHILVGKRSILSEFFQNVTLWTKK